MDKNKTIIDKRNKPRYKTHFPATVKTSTGEVLEAIVTNISLSGLQLTGCEDMPYKLFADRHQQKGGIAIFNIYFSVPTSTRESVTIDIDCQSVYVRRLAKDQSIAGCQFIHFNNETEKELEDYITHFGERL